MSSRFATLSFARDVAAPVGTLWQVWTAPAARAIWAAPSPSVTVEVLEADPTVGGRELSLCKVAGQPDIRCETTWLELQPGRRSVNSEAVSSVGQPRSAALVTADFSDATDGSRLVVTVQFSSTDGDMETRLRHVTNRSWSIRRFLIAVQCRPQVVDALPSPGRNNTKLAEVAMSRHRRAFSTTH